MVGGIFCLVAGTVHFFFSGIDAILADAQPGELDWIYRVLGSGYIELGIGMLRIYKNPAGRGVFISMLIMMSGLVCVAFAITFALLVYARRRARDIL